MQLVIDVLEEAASCPTVLVLEVPRVRPARLADFASTEDALQSTIRPDRVAALAALARTLLSVRVASAWVLRPRTPTVELQRRPALEVHSASTDHAPRFQHLTPIAEVEMLLAQADRSV